MILRCSDCHIQSRDLTVSFSLGVLALLCVEVTSDNSCSSESSSATDRYRHSEEW